MAEQFRCFTYKQEWTQCSDNRVCFELELFIKPFVTHSAQQVLSVRDSKLYNK